MQLHNPKREWLEQAVDSVLAQSYEKWQLCLCDDASSDTWVREYLRGLAGIDRRIQCVSSAEQSGISGALNQAGSLALGEYVAFWDHDDILAENALRAVIEVLQRGAADIVYSDEDYIDSDGQPVRPGLKPGWSPELLLNCMYLGRFSVVSRAAIERAGWFRSEYDGAQDYDLRARSSILRS